MKGPGSRARTSKDSTSNSPVPAKTVQPSRSSRAIEEAPASPANRRGYGHLAFAVADVAAALDVVLEHGGDRLGKVVEHDVPCAGRLTFTYCRDPEGNIIELQNWRSAS